MTDLHIGERAQTAVGHPLDRLTADEIRTAADVLRDSKLLGDSVRLPVLALEEPPKAEVLAFAPGTDFDRRVRAVLLDTATGSSRSAVVSVTRRQVDDVADLDPLVDGQPPIMLEEFDLVDAIVKADAGWRDAMARRGVTDLDLVCACPLSAGAFDLPGEEGRRMLRVLSFLQHRPSDHPLGAPDRRRRRVRGPGRRARSSSSSTTASCPCRPRRATSTTPAYVGPHAHLTAPHRDHPAARARASRSTATS